MTTAKYIFCVDNPTDPEKFINYYYVDREFINLNSTISTSSPPSLEQEVAESLISALRMPQNKAKDSFCSKKEEGVSEEYIIDEFISKKKSNGSRNILINTVIYYDTDNKPFAFLMYKQYPSDANSMYISILCINSLQPKSEFSAMVYGDQIINNFKVACESVGIHNIYLESIPSAETFWRQEGFKMVDPQPIYSDSSKTRSKSRSSKSDSSRSNKRDSKSKTRSNKTRSSSSKTRSSKSKTRSSSSSDSNDKLFYFNIIPETGSKGKGKKGKKGKTNKHKTKRHWLFI
jgi:hypothetical protein